MVYTIKNEKLCVSVSSTGAELVSVKFNGKERLWQNDNGEWDGHSPVLFPFAGHVEVKVYGKTYPLSVHGVVWQSSFSLTEQKEDTLRFSCCSSKETRKYYPYSFIFDVIYTIKDNCLMIDYEVRNPSDEEIYFSIGAHESFNVDSELEDYFIEFEKDEHFIQYENDVNGYLTGKTTDYGKGKELSFEKFPLLNDNSFVFKGINSTSVTLKKKTGEKVATSYFNGFNNILFWRPGKGKTVCIEPWQNLPDSVNEECKEFKDKYGITNLEPKSLKKFSRKVEYFDE